MKLLKPPVLQHPSIEKCRSSVFASYAMHSAKASAKFTHEKMGLKTVVMDYLGFVNAFDTPNIDLWV